MMMIRTGERENERNNLLVNLEPGDIEVCPVERAGVVVHMICEPEHQTRTILQTRGR